ncbi:RadC family protein [Gudongella oleilytica]|jgi:DNA repair protein RadC|uniref:RadC family protein n=1 Tax=Gudongella oleilytica TaxID=1582259 RepID=UPI000FF89594|nr:DNA repair protein RadC [Gudongella oleilytica]HMM69041.1 DNA repair protein RadC [Gudongella oleilytica]
MQKNDIRDKGYTIKDLPKSERPREKLLAHGPDALSNAELLAVIIRTGTGSETAIEVSTRLLGMDNRGIRHLMDASINDLTKIKGIGECKAAQIIAAIELGRRIKRIGYYDKVRVTSPEIVAEVLMDEMSSLYKEHFRTVILDTKNQIICIENISIGTLNASIVHPRDVFKAAIKNNGNSVILVHNHPSGDTTPSVEDINITKRLVEGGNLMGIKVLDHLIVGNGTYLSMKEKNLM